jgi:serine/threonine protein kinase
MKSNTPVEEIDLSTEHCRIGRLQNIEIPLYWCYKDTETRHNKHYIATWWNEKTEKHIFIKVAFDDIGKHLVQREQELHRKAQQASTHVLPLVDIPLWYEGRPLPCVVTEYHGSDLSHAAAKGELGPQILASILADAAQGLKDLHYAGMIHTDVKPHNIIVAKNSDTERLEGKLIDFEPAQEIGTKRVPNFYTDDYESPERTRARLNRLQLTSRPAEDAYSLAYSVQEILKDEVRGGLKGAVTLNLHENPKKRPGMDPLIHELRNFGQARF